MARRFAARCSAFALTAATVCLLPTTRAVWIAKPHRRTNQSLMIAAQARIVASQNGSPDVPQQMIRPEGVSRHLRQRYV